MIYLNYVSDVINIIKMEITLKFPILIFNCNTISDFLDTVYHWIPNGKSFGKVSYNLCNLEFKQYFIIYFI